MAETVKRAVRKRESIQYPAYKEDTSSECASDPDDPEWESEPAKDDFLNKYEFTNNDFDLKKLKNKSFNKTPEKRVKETLLKKTKELVRQDPKERVEKDSKASPLNVQTSTFVPVVCGKQYVQQRSTGPIKELKMPPLYSWDQWSKLVNNAKNPEALLELTLCVNIADFFKCMAHSCFFTSDDYAFFNMHMEQEHRSINLFCIYCLKLFKAGSVLSDHMVKEHGNLVFQCPKCIYRASTDTHLNIHRKMYHNGDSEEPLQCLNQNIYEEMLEPMVQRDLQKYICKVENCNFSCEVIKDFTKHCSSHKGISDYLCGYCPLKFNGLQDLMGHYKEIHEMAQFHCCYCSFASDVKKDVLTHQCLMHASFLIFIRTRESADENIASSSYTATKENGALVFSAGKSKTSQNESFLKKAATVKGKRKSQAISSTLTKSTTEKISLVSQSGQKKLAKRKSGGQNVQVKNLFDSTDSELAEKSKLNKESFPPIQLESENQITSSVSTNPSSPSKSVMNKKATSLPLVKENEISSSGLRDLSSQDVTTSHNEDKSGTLPSKLTKYSASTSKEDPQASNNSIDIDDNTRTTSLGNELANLDLIPETDQNSRIAKLKDETSSNFSRDSNQSYEKYENNSEAKGVGNWCVFCNEIFKSSKGLKIHLIRSCLAEENSKKKKWTVPINTKKFIEQYMKRLDKARSLTPAERKKYLYPKRQTILIPDTKYCCNMCSFKTESCLECQRHMFNHVGYKSFVCENCQKGFYTQSDLQKHLEMHMEDTSVIRYDVYAVDYWLVHCIQSFCIKRPETSEAIAAETIPKAANRALLEVTEKEIKTQAVKDKILKTTSSKKMAKPSLAKQNPRITSSKRSTRKVTRKKIDPVNTVKDSTNQICSQTNSEESQANSEESQANSEESQANSEGSDFGSNNLPEAALQMDSQDSDSEPTDDSDLGSNTLPKVTKGKTSLVKQNLKIKSAKKSPRKVTIKIINPVEAISSQNNSENSDSGSNNLPEAALQVDSQDSYSEPRDFDESDLDSDKTPPKPIRSFTKTIRTIPKRSPRISPIKTPEKIKTKDGDVGLSTESQWQFARKRMGCVNTSNPAAHSKMFARKRMGGLNISNPAAQSKRCARKSTEGIAKRNLRSTPLKKDFARKSTPGMERIENVASTSSNFVSHYRNKPAKFDSSRLLFRFKGVLIPVQVWLEKYNFNPEIKLKDIFDITSYQ